MGHNYRTQNESGHWQDHSRSGQRGGTGRDRYETGNESRYRPDWEQRFREASSQEETGFEGDRSYSAGGYPEEFGYRREPGERDRSNQQRSGGAQPGRDEQRFGGSYYDRPYAGQGRNDDYQSRDFGQSGSQRAFGQRPEFGPDEPVNHGRNDYSGSGFYGGGGRNYYGSQGGFGSQGAPGGQGSQGTYRGSGGRDFGSERQGEFGRQSQQQSYRGRGPKGYERSDERLREMVCERLTDDPSIDASEVTVEVTSKVVKLTGTVDDRRTKYLIEDVIEQVGGVRDIDNQLRVQSASQSQASQHGAGSDNTSGGRINIGQPGIPGQSGSQSGSLGQSSPSTTTPSKRN